MAQVPGERYAAARVRPAISGGAEKSHSCWPLPKRALWDPMAAHIGAYAGVRYRQAGCLAVRRSRLLGHISHGRLTAIVTQPANTPKYQAFWCEENIWHLAQDPVTAASERLVLAISGVSGRVACWQQSAGEPGEGVLWDYHVVLATKPATWQIWDLDSRLGAPVSATIWLKETFPYPDFVQRRFHPRFAVIDGDAYVRTFSSDRSHMRDKFGSWLHKPPPWPAICGTGLGLQDLRRQARNGLETAELADLLR